MGFLTIFRKPKHREPLSVDAVESTALVSPGGSRHNVLAKHGVRSLLDTGMAIEGNLISDRGAAIDGIVNGDVTVREQNSALLLRAGAVVRGCVSAPIVLVSGTVEGSISARFVRLYPGSKVIGRIQASRLVVDDGAQIINDDVGAGLVLEAAPVQAPAPAPTVAVHEVESGESWRATLTMQGGFQPSTGQSTAAFLRSVSR